MNVYALYIGANLASLWDSEVGAKQRICEYISSDMIFWDTTDPYIYQEFLNIETAIITQDWDRAIRLYDSSTTKNTIYTYQSFKVQSVNSFGATIAQSNCQSTVTASSSAGNLNYPCNITSNIPAPVINWNFDPIPDARSLPTQFIPDKPGAICRQCNNNSPDAYADKDDGTFVCYGCKLYKSMI